MARYAENTTVPVAKTRGEIEALLEKHGAEEFMHASGPGRAVVGFKMKGRLIKISVTLPDPAEKEFWQDRSASWRKVSAETAKARFDQACRRKWRATLLIVKAKLEVIQDGDSTLDREFMADLVLDNGQTVGEAIIPALERSYANGGPALLPSGL